MHDFRHFRFCPLRWNLFLWLEFSSCNRNFLPVTGNFVLWWEITSCNRKFFPVTKNFFFELKFCPVTGNFFLSEEISSWSYLKIALKACDFRLKLCLRVQGFVARFLPPCPLKSLTELRSKMWEMWKCVQFYHVWWLRNIYECWGTHK